MVDIAPASWIASDLAAAEVGWCTLNWTVDRQKPKAVVQVSTGSLTRK